MNGKTILYIICTLVGLTAIVGCSSDKPTHLEPRLGTLDATDITRNTATLHGMVSLEGDTDMPKLLFRYGDTESMNNVTAEVQPNGANVDLPIEGLTAGTTYYYRLEGSNGRVTTTGNVMSFTTQPNVNPTLQPMALLSHGPTSTIVAYEISDDGGEPVTETGCYVYLADAPEEKYKCAVADFDGKAGKVKLRIGDLKRNSDYQFVPFAKNSVGESTGDPVGYTTTDAVVLDEAGEFMTLMGENLYEHTSLSLAGAMNGDDLSCLRLMMGRDPSGAETQGKLTDIDMTDVEIVSGGGHYGASRYTQDGVVGQGLFADCDRLTRVVLPAKATTLEKDAFENCVSLSKIVIAANIRSLLPSSGCTALEEISVSSANANYSSQDGVLLNADGTEIVWFPMGKKGEYTLPSSVTSIADYAFKECSIETFLFPDGLKSIGQGAFMNSKVREVTLPEQLKQLPTGTFQNCTQLQVVHLGSRMELITAYAFDQCPLTDLYVQSADPPVCEENAFSYSMGTSYTSTCVLHVPAGTKKVYQAHSKWKVFTHITED